MKSKDGQKLFVKLAGDFAGKKAAGFELSEGMMQMMGGFTMLRMLSLAGGMMDLKFTREQLLELNEQLNQIPRAE